MANLLDIRSVIKTYGDYKAVNNVSLSIPEGCIFGLLGPNGAGKTSLIRMITTITRPDGGEIWFNGEKLNSRHPEQIGYMPEERGLYKKMKVGEQLLYLAQLKGMSYNDARTAVKYWIERLDIADWWGKTVEELSKGMSQKLQFIATVIHKPRLLILDEPFSGLDPVNANLIKDEIYELHRQGTTILFSTHRMEQVEEICDSIVLINKGQNILEGEVSEVKNRFKENLFSVEFKGSVPENIATQFNIMAQTDRKLTFKLNEGQSSNDILRALLNHQATQITAFNEILPSLNEIFIRQVQG